MLQALQTRDVGRLRELALTEDEFRSIVWPELPAARPERNVPVEFAWNSLRIKSEASLQRTVAAYGGRALDLGHIRFDGGTSHYQTYLVHRESVLTLRGDEQGEEQVRLFGSVFERAGRFKVFSYVVD